MNNDSTPASAADLLATNTSNPNGETIEPVRRREDALTPAQKRVQAQTKKKSEFINGLMTNLDTLIYVELCIVYYMDCSLFRLLLRVLPQMVFLTPKPSFIPPAPQHRPYIGAIFGSNIICLLLHLFTSHPEAGEAMRGYLHGGVIIDLIGHKGPTSKFQLLLLDVLITVLQCFMLAVHVEKERLQTVMKDFGLASSRAALGSRGIQGPVRVVSAQDMDAEERGVLRDGVTSNGDIELQSLAVPAPGNDTTREHSDSSLERERLLEEPTSNESPLDLFWSGSAIISDFHVLENLRVQWRDYGNATGSALQTVGFSAEFAAVAANRRINAATARFQRNMEALNV